MGEHLFLNSFHHNFHYSNSQSLASFSSPPKPRSPNFNLSPSQEAHHLSYVQFHKHKQMAAKPLTSETIALTEKKMDMTLDDIIKMSKTNTTKTKKQKVSNRNQIFSNNITQDKSAKIRRFMDAKSSMRQWAFARRRSNLQGDQFPLATEAARRAAVAPIRNRSFSRSRAVNVYKQRFGAPPVPKNAANRGRFTVKQQNQEVKAVSKQRPQTLDSLFANMKEQRMKMQSQQNNAPKRNERGQLVVPWARCHFDK